MPVGDGAAGTTDYRHERSDVPRVHDWIDGDIDETCREHEVAIAICPGAVEAGRVDQAITRGAVLILAEIEMVAGHQSRLVESGGGAATGGLAVERGGLVIADGELTERGLIDRAEDGLALVKQGDKGRPQWNAGDEAFGAIDGIEHPDPFGIRAIAAMFFADDTVVRKAFTDHFAHKLFRPAIGGCDGGRIGLEFHGGAGVAKERCDEICAGGGKLEGEFAV